MPRKLLPLAVVLVLLFLVGAGVLAQVNSPKFSTVPLIPAGVGQLSSPDLNAIVRDDLFIKQSMDPDSADEDAVSELFRIFDRTAVLARPITLAAILSNDGRRRIFFFDGQEVGNVLG